MKSKEGRDFLKFNDCIVTSVGSNTRVSDLGSSFLITPEEFKQLIAFVQKKQQEQK